MPELPEVETVRRTLKELVIGRTIKSIDIYYSKMILDDIDYFRESLIGKTIKDINRKGKFLIFVFDDLYLLSHLRMEGKYYFKDSNEPHLKHEHVVFTFNDGKTLRYHDTRKFGIMTIRKNDLYDIPPLSLLGEEPFNLDTNVLYNKLQRLKKTIKEALLDQSIMAGLGNIYVDEVCFLSKINPSTKANKLTIEDCSNIINSSIITLNKSISLGGSTIRSYTSSLGVTGRFQNELFVHTKTTCPNCKKDLTILKIGGRTTYFCDKCQILR